MPKSKIITGLKSSVRYARGDHSQGTTTIVHVRPAKSESPEAYSVDDTLEQIDVLIKHHYDALNRLRKIRVAVASSTHRERHLLNVENHLKEKVISKVCPGCGQPFIIGYGGFKQKRRKTCSDTCRTRVSRMLKVQQHNQCFKLRNCNDIR